MFDKAYQSLSLCVDAEFRMSTDACNQKCFNAKTWTKLQLVAHSFIDIQDNLDCFSEASNNFCLIINITKTEQLFRARRHDTNMNKSSICIDG